MCVVAQVTVIGGHVDDALMVGGGVWQNCLINGVIVVALVFNPGRHRLRFLARGVRRACHVVELLGGKVVKAIRQVFLGGCAHAHEHLLGRLGVSDQRTADVSLVVRAQALRDVGRVIDRVGLGSFLAAAQQKCDRALLRALNGRDARGLKCNGNRG